MKCVNCNAELQYDAKFCSFCGSEQRKETKKTAIPETEHNQEFNLIARNADSLRRTIYTKITVNGETMHIEQTKEFFGLFKSSSSHYRLNIADITDIVRQRNIHYLDLSLAVIAVMIGFAQHSYGYLAFGLFLGFIAIDKTTVLYTKNHKISIPAYGKTKRDLDGLLYYLKQIHPAINMESKGKRE